MRPHVIPLTRIRRFILYEDGFLRLELRHPLEYLICKVSQVCNFTEQKQLTITFDEKQQQQPF